MKKRLFNALMVGLIICSTYVFAFADVLSPTKKDCEGNGHWEQDRSTVCDYICVVGGTECNDGQTKSGSC